MPRSNHETPAGPARRPLRWPSGPAAWAGLALLIPAAAAAGFLCGLLGPAIWLVACLAPV